MTASFRWFEGIGNVQLASSISEVPILLEECLVSSGAKGWDWNEKHFDHLCQVFDVTG